MQTPAATGQVHAMMSFANENQQFTPRLADRGQMRFQGQAARCSTPPHGWEHAFVSSDQMDWVSMVVFSGLVWSGLAQMDCLRRPNGLPVTARTEPSGIGTNWGEL